LGGNGTAGGDIVSPKTINFSNTTGNITANNFVLSSSEKVKTNILEINNKEKFDDIKFIQYSYIDDIAKRTRYGVIAEDVEKIASELVYKNGNDYTVAYIDLLVAKIARLEEKLKILEDRIDERCSK